MFRSRAAADSIAPLRGFTLWIDGCGGFRLLTGSRWSIGGNQASATCDVAVQTDWPRRAGDLVREDIEYFWVSESEERHWIRHGEAVPIPGSARLILRRPSPLSQSVSLELESAHRFANHVDAVVLVQDTVLVGPGLDCHIRCRNLADRLVLLERDGKWRVKIGKSTPVDLKIGVRFTDETLTMTLERS